MIPIVDAETAKKLKDVGYPQNDSAYYWVAKTTAWGKDYIRMTKADVQFDAYEYFAAPDALELGWRLINAFVYTKQQDDLIAGCFGIIPKEHHTLQDMADAWRELEINNHPV